MSLTETNLDKTPEFYRAPAFPAHIERLGNDSLLGSTSLTIKNIYRGELTVNGSVFGAELITIEHNSGKIYEPYIRMRVKGTTNWQTLPSTFQLDGTLAGTIYIHLFEIKANTIILEFFNSSSVGIEGLCEIEIFFLDFSTKARFT